MDKRFIGMLRAAIPYASRAYQKPLQIVLQTEELLSYAQGETEEDLVACDTDKTNDLMGMMESIRPFCNKSEQEMVDTLLNFMKTRQMYDAYRTFTSYTKNNSEGNMMDYLMSQLTPEQQVMFSRLASGFGGSDDKK